MKQVFAFISLLLVFGVMLYLPRGCSHGYPARVDTVTVVRTDTVRDTVPTVVEKRIVRTEVVHLYLEAEIDSLCSEVDSEAVSVMGDSVAIPITQKTYEAETYKAWVSGWHASLDSIEVYQKTVERTITITKTTKPKRWGIGVQVGYGYSIKGFTPYIGVGISYNLLTF